MEQVKEIFDTLSERVQSPFLGWIAGSFLIINWKSIFYLLFADQPVLSRFSYFDANTDFYSLLIIPTTSGIIGATFYPWAKLIGAWLATEPNKRYRLRRDRVSNEVLAAKNKLASERNRALAVHEEELIQRAQRDAEVNDIEDEDVRSQVKKEIKRARESGDGESSISEESDAKEILSQIRKSRALALLNLAAETVNGKFKFVKYNDDASIFGIVKFGSDEKTIASRNDYIKFKDEVEILTSFDLLEEEVGEEFYVTRQGYEVSETAKNEES